MTLEDETSVDLGEFCYVMKEAQKKMPEEVLPRSPRKQICSQSTAKSVRNAEDDQVDCKQGSARKACHKCRCSDVGPSRWIRTNLEMNGIVAQRDLFGRFRSRRIFFAAGAHEEYGICFNLCSIFQSYFSSAHLL